MSERDLESSESRQNETEEGHRRASLAKLVLWTLPFVAAYFVIRAAPVEPCEFLHPRTYNAAGELDYCGPGDSEFVDLSRRSWPVTLTLQPLDEIRVGEPCRFQATITQFDGSPLGPDDVALSHTEKIHLLAIDPALRDYQHLHPEPDAIHPGVWNFILTPSQAGSYRLFLDFIPLRSPRRVLLSASFDVSGAPLKPLEKQSLVTEVEGRRFTVQVAGGQSLKTGEKARLVFEAKDGNGQPVVLQPVMGAFAHLVAFDSERKGFAHLHPFENETSVEAGQTHSGALTFAFRPPAAGHFRLWAQVRTGDRQVFIPFDLLVKT